MSFLDEARAAWPLTPDDAVALPLLPDDAGTLPLPSDEAVAFFTRCGDGLRDSLPLRLPPPSAAWDSRLGKRRREAEARHWLALAAATGPWPPDEAVAFFTSSRDAPVGEVPGRAGSIVIPAQLRSTFSAATMHANAPPGTAGDGEEASDEEYEGEREN